MSTTRPQYGGRHRRASRSRTSTASLSSVYVDMAATSEAVCVAVAKMPVPPKITNVGIDDHSFTDTFGCRIVVDLTGTFDQATEGRLIARRYALGLSALLGVPAYALHDLLCTDPGTFIY